MAGMIAKLLGAKRYRQRWRALAAAAEVAAEKATTELDRKVRDRDRRRRTGQQHAGQPLPPQVPSVAGR